MNNMLATALLESLENDNCFIIVPIISDLMI